MNRRPGTQSYAEYLATMKAYNFNPLDRDTWQWWQDLHERRQAAVDSAVGWCAI